MLAADGTTARVRNIGADVAVGDWVEISSDGERVDRRAKDDQNALVARHGGRERALGIGPPGATPAPGA